MKNIYISPDGDGNGSTDSPCSLEKARELVREINKSMTADINVYLNGGVYYLTSPFVLTPEDSGSNGFFVRWQNKPETAPVFTGAKTITDWSVHDAKKNIWKASVPENTTFEHLWVNGVRCRRAWSGWNPKGFKNTRRGVKIKRSGPDVSTWKHPEDLIVTKKCMWRHIPGKVHHIRNRELVVEPETARTFKVPLDAMGVSEPFIIYVILNGIALLTADIAIENAYELLTDEGEWYFDRSDATIYFKPFTSDNVNFNTASEAVYSTLETFILLDGTVDNPIKNIEIKGLTFEYNRGTKLGITAGSPTEPTKAKTPLPQNALQINAGHSITITSNVFRHITTDALHFDLLGKDLNIIGNGFGDISRAAISLNQTNTVVDSRNKRGVLPENEDKFFDGVEITNNYVRYTGIDDIGAAIVYSEFTRNLKLMHNDIREVPTCAVRNGWRFLAWKNHTANIEYAWNRTSDVGQANLEDFCALYISCNNHRGSSIHHNVIDGAGLKDGNYGIYLDVYTNHVNIYNNVCKNMPQKHGSLPGVGGWLGLVISKHNNIYNNWTDSRCKTDISPPFYRYLPSLSNKFHDNHFYVPSTGEWPDAARQIIAKAGLEPKYRHIKDAIDNTLDNGYIPLKRLYTLTEKPLCGLNL